MVFGKKQILVAFLERDNVKLLAYEVSGKSASRIFGGQVSFGEDTLRDAFISDPVKFASQVKMVLMQKPPLSLIVEGSLFIHADKTFIKAMPPSESLEAFVKSLPFFKEELVIQELGAAGNSQVSAGNLQVNYVAFEKKLVEDFERPFLESGKKILGVNSAIMLLARKYKQGGRYLLVLPFEKDVTVAACQDGVILDLTTVPKDVWVGRMGEFRIGKGYSDITSAFVVGNLEPGVADKIKNEQQLSVSELGGGDIYDQAVGTSGTTGSAGGGGLPKISLPEIPGKKYIFLVAAAIVGFVLVFLILKNFKGVSLPGNPISQKPTPTEVVKKPIPTPTPEAKPADFKVTVLNGTSVAGEASRLGDVLTELGFDIVETANATSSGFEATRLRTISTVPESIIAQIREKLLETYLSVNLETMPEGESPIEIIIGEKKPAT